MWLWAGYIYSVQYWKSQPNTWSLYIPPTSRLLLRPPLETHRLRSTEPRSNRVRLKWHCLQFLICIPSSVHRKMKMMPMVAKQLQQLTVQSHPGIASIPRKASQVVIHDPLTRWIPCTTGCNMPWYAMIMTCYSRMHIHPSHLHSIQNRSKQHPPQITRTKKIVKKTNTGYIQPMNHLLDIQPMRPFVRRFTVGLLRWLKSPSS